MRCCSEHATRSPTAADQRAAAIDDEADDGQPGPWWAAIYSAPWWDDGVAYYPTSPTTGRAVAQTLAQRQFVEMYGSLRAKPVSGLHHDERHMFRVRLGHAQVMQLYERRPWEYSDRERAVVELYWRQGVSETVAAYELAVSPARVHTLIGNVRWKARTRQVAVPQVA